MFLPNTATIRQVIHRTGVAGLFLCLACQSALTAQEPPVESSRLSLDAAIEEALANNLGLRMDRIDPINADDSVEIAKADFDPVITASIEHSEGEQVGVSILPPAKPIYSTTPSDDRSYRAGVQKKLTLTNATLSATTSWGRNGNSSLKDNTSLSVSLNQPLLRDFGSEIATADLEQARADQRKARLQLKNATFEVLSSVESSYWNLAEATAVRALRETNRELAERLLEETTERERLGLSTALDVIEAEANLAQREEEILVAQQIVDDAKDALLRVIGRMQDGLALSADVTVAALPPVAVVTPELSLVWRETIESDFASLQQEETILQRQIDTTVAKNDRKPTLDLEVSASVSGASIDSAYDAIDRTIDSDGKDWSVYFSFSYPLGQRAANAQFRTARRELDRAEIQLIELKQMRLQEVRKTWRELDTRKRRMHAAELVLRLQEQTFEQERSKLDEGLSTLRDVLQIQRDLDNARLSLLSAQAAAIRAEVSLERLRGTLLERHGLTWAEIAPGILN